METPGKVLRATARLYQRISAQIIVLLAFMGVLYFLTYFLLNSGIVNRAFDETVNSLFRGRITWTRLTWGPLPWTLRALEPQLVGADGRAVISADAVHIGNIELLGLLRGRIAASAIVVEQPVIRLVQRPHAEETDAWGEVHGVFNIEEMFWPPERWADDGVPGNPPTLDFSDASIVGARGVVDLPSFWLSAHGLDIAGGRFSLVNGTLHMGAEQFAAQRVRMRVPASGDLEVPVREADRDEIYAWTFNGLEGAHYLWNGMIFGVAQLNVLADGDPLAVRNFQMDLDAGHLPAVRGQVTLAVRDLATHLGRFELNGISGPAKIRVDVPRMGPLDGLDGHALLQLGSVSYADWHLERMQAEVDVTALDRFTLRDLTLDAYGGHLQGSGAFDLLDGSAHFRGWGADFEPGRLPIALPERFAHLWLGKARVSLMAGVTDLLGAPRGWADAQVDLKRSAVSQPSYGLNRSVQVLANGTFEGSVLQIRHASLQGGLTADTRGSLDLDQATLDLQGRASSARIAATLAPFGVPLSGRGSVRYHLTGALESPQISGTVQGRGLTYPNLPPADVDATLTFDVGTLRLDLKQSEVRTEVGRSQISGWLSFLGTPRGDLKAHARGVKIDALPLARLVPGGLDVGGTLDAHVRLQGALSRPRVSGTAVVQQPRYGDLTYERLELEGAWAGRAVTVKTLRLLDRVQRGESRHNVERLTAHGSYTPQNKRFDGRLRLHELDLSLINRFVEPAIPLRGQVTLVLGGEGPIDNPSGTGELTLEGVGYDQLELGDGQITLNAEGQMLNLDGHLFKVLHLNGGLPTTGGGPPGRITLAVQSLRLETLLPELAEADASVAFSGHVSAILDLWSGDDLLQSVEVRVNELALGYSLRDMAGRVVHRRADRGCEDCPSFGLRALEPVRLVWLGEELIIESLRLGGGGQSFEVLGTARPNWLDLQVAGTLSLQALWPVLRSVFTDVEGAGQFAFNISGQPANPTFEGDVRLESADLIPRSATIGSELRLLDPVTIRVQPPYGPQMPDARGRMPRGVFTVFIPPTVDEQPNRLRLHRDDGEVEVVQASGWFKDFKPEALLVEVRTDEAELDVPRTLNVTVATPSLTFELWEQVPEGRRLPETRLRLSGHLDLLRGEYVADITSAAEISQGVRNNFSGRAVRRQVSIFERAPILKNLEVDLSARGDDELFVRNQVTVLNVNLAVAVDLRRLKGFIYPQGDRQLSIDGRVEILEDSQVTYARRPFDVTLGEIEFRPEKFLQADLAATHTFRLRTDTSSQAGTFDRGASGDVREEEVTLQVNVSLDQLGGEPEFSLNFSSSSGASKIEVATLVLTGAYPSDLTGAASATPATEILLSPVLSLIEAPFEETLDVDLSLTPATTGTLFIDADKLLSRRLRLYSRTPVGDDAGNNPLTFGLEYRLNNRLTGELTTEKLGNLNSTSGRLRLQILVD
jgi:hypothetical protein